MTFLQHHVTASLVAATFALAALTTGELAQATRWSVVSAKHMAVVAAGRAAIALGTPGWRLDRLPMERWWVE